MSTKLERLDEQLAKHAPEKETEFNRELALQIFGKASRNFLEEHDTETLSAILKGAVKFLDNKSSDEIRVRAKNPRYDVDGWESNRTALEITLSDRPFIVDSVSHGLKRLGIELHSLIHPILALKRDDNGKIVRKVGTDGTEAEAYELFLIEQLPDDKLPELEARVTEILEDVKAATDDYGAMREQVARLCERFSSLAEKHASNPVSEEIKENVEFLQWLDDHHFVFLGYREYDLESDNGTQALRTTAGSGLGTLRERKQGGSIPMPFDKLTDDLPEQVVSGPPIIVTKADRESTVHRPVKLDYVGLKKFDDDLNAVGKICFLGLFTSNALTTPVKDIPIVRRRLDEVLELDQAAPGSHDFKQIVTIFNSMPRAELFWSDVDLLHRDIRTIMTMQSDHDVRLTLRPDPLNRGALVLVVMPRDRFNSNVRHRVQEHLKETFEASQVDFQLSMGEDEGQVRFHFFLTTDINLSSVDLVELEARVVDLTRSWNDRLNERLVAVHGDAGLKLRENFYRSFPDGYMANTNFGMAVRDVENLVARVDSKKHFRVGLFNPTDSPHEEEVSTVRIYHNQKTLVLSEVLPILENLGLRVLLQSSHNLNFRHDNDEQHSTIDVFHVQNRWTQKAIDLRTHCDRFVEAVTALLNEEAENHPLNGLILAGGLTWREVSLLRSYQAYLSQVSVSTSRRFITQALLAHPECAALIYRFFEARFRPEFSGREAEMEQIKERFFDSLTQVSSLAYDHTLRALFNLVESTLRSNFYLGKKYIAHKIKSSDVLEMPAPRPALEIVVIGLNMEGIHLRGGPVARGGLRWSDRPDDYRTEVLGLLKTQTTKNAVIVPVGSKGGFVIKNAPTDREELGEYVKEQYRTFIRGLLDLTDNIKAGKVLHPAGLVIYDGEDPYMVVAADKGTAKFSDIANGVSAEYDFWLGDAFASGGSQGYDHKKQGITARGAWESVKRHFFELGIDVMKDEFTVAGIGDMAGDVFGNGMLYTDKIRLQAAFNHIHIFIDPSPDAASTYKERKRLFELPRSSWADFNPELISKGGGVFERAAKSIPLSPEMKEMFGVDVDEMNGQELIQAVLTMKVDLLYNGGIGNYVRASTETNADAGDSSNDSVRVTADKLQARVVGEGGNGGFTQLARIEYAKNGGRNNTDAIDNSAGVDMSDHEVNIKLLLQPLVAQGKMTLEKRNDILEEMTDEVSKLVLKDNYWQTLCLSIAERRSKEDLTLFSTLMDYLAERGPLDKEVEFLPDHKAVQERMRTGAGFTRPELAIILAYTKMGIYRRILETDFPDEPLFQHYLLDYFPELLKNGYADEIRRHSLHREIIATQFTNVVVDLLGITFVHRTIRDTGATPIQVIRAGLAALELVDAKEFLGKLGEFDRDVSAEDFYGILSGLVRALENVVNWILLTDADLSSLSRFIGNYKEGLKRLRGDLSEILPQGEKERLASLQAGFEKMGFNEEFSAYVASLDYVPSGIGIVDNARIADIPLKVAASRFYEVGERLRFAWLRGQLRSVQTKDKWQTIAIVGLIMDLRQIQLRLSLAEVDLDSLPGNPVARYEQFLNEIVSEEAFGQASGDVLARLLAQIVEGARRKALEGSIETDSVVVGV